MSKQPKKSDKKRHPNAALKYSGMAFQMAVIMGLGVFAGKKADEYFGFEQSFMTALGAILGLILAFYLILKDLK